MLNSVEMFFDFWVCWAKRGDSNLW